MVLRLIVLACLTLAARCVIAADPFPVFRERVIDPEIGQVCYAVTVADVDGDGKQDIVAVSENRVLWYRQGDWSPHVVIADQAPRDHVCIAPHDIDGDGQIDFALGASWTGKNAGTIHWLKRRETLDRPWQVFSIGAEPWAHRMRWADVLGTGAPQLVVSPLNATSGPGVRLLAFEIPENPQRDRWRSTVLNADLNRMHNHFHVDWDGDGRVDTLAAAQQGVFAITQQDDDWTAKQIGVGASSDQPQQSGAGEIRVGKLKNGARYFVTVEPMHGTMLAVYTRPPQGELWTRQLIDEGFRRGHALWTADLDGDGDDEIVFGHSDTPDVPGVNVYNCLDGHATQWEKHLVDAGGMATEDLIVGDVTGDGRPDIIAGGRATRNVKLYVNTAR